VKTLLVFATDTENQLSKRILKKCDFLITGIGKLNAALSLFQALQKKPIERIVNVGICGSLVPRYDVGEILAIHRVIEGDRDSFGESLQWDLPVLDRSLPKAVLVTRDTTIKTVFEKKQMLSMGGEVVDMEGVALAKVARKMRVPLYCLKIVSDRVNAHSSKTILKNIVPCSQKICAHVESLTCGHL
jgi:adenosylhomocysteine nucleosidase